MENLQKQLESLRRWRWLILAFVVLATVAAVAIALAGGTQYKATATVVVGSASTQSSSSRSPDQDAVLARGYVELLNSKSKQDALKEAGNISGDVDIEATPVATSPFIDITATASTAEEAVSASSAFAQAFVDNTLNTFNDIVSVRLQPLRQRLTQLSTQIAENQQRLDDSQRSVNNGGAPLLTAGESAKLKGEVQQLQAEATGLSEQLREQAAVVGNPNLAGLYSEPAGATVVQSSVTRNAVLGIIGGLLLGGAVALILGSLELRIRSSRDVRDKLDLPTIGSVSRGRGEIAEARRTEDFKALATALSVMKPAVSSVAVVSPGDGEGKSLIASNLARYRAAQGARVILIHADIRDQRASLNGSENGRAARDGSPGLSDLLADAGRPDIQAYLSRTSQPNLYVMNAGADASDPYTLFSSSRINEVMSQAGLEADLVVVDTSSLLSAAESQIISAGVDASVLVLDTTLTQPTAAMEARDVLQRSGANVVGVILNRVNKGSSILS
jgi:capsular exopolysaccharide synthesis family protein